MRACDNCFAQKERCTYSKAIDCCDRCARLSRACTTNRPARRLGRKPLLPDTLKDVRSLKSTRVNAVDRALSPFGFLSNSLQPCEEFIIRQLSDPSQLAGFAIAPKIADDVHQQIMYTLLNHYEETHDGFVSCYAAFAAMKLVEIPIYVGDSLERGNVALRNFRQLKPPTDLQEFVPWIWLSLCVCLHTRCALGWSASSIRRYVLSHIAQLGEKGTEMASHPIMIIMIAGHIYECLVERSMPLINIPECDLEHMGAFVSTCAPLFRILFDLCMIRSTHNQPDQLISGYDEEYLKALEELERTVQAWQPALQTAAVGSLSEAGLAHLQVQVRTHSMAVLLCIYRSKNESRSGDALALNVAHQIMDDLDYVTFDCGQAPSCVSLPFTTAAIEMKDGHERAKALQDVPAYVTGTPFGIHAVFRTFLGDLWSWRDALEEHTWTRMLQRIPASCITI